MKLRYISDTITSLIPVRRQYLAPSVLSEENDIAVVESDMITITKVPKNIFSEFVIAFAVCCSTVYTCNLPAMSKQDK